MTLGKLFCHLSLQIFFESQDVWHFPRLFGDRQEREYRIQKRELCRTVSLICTSSQLDINVHILHGDCFLLLNSESHYMPTCKIFVKDFSPLLLFLFFRLYLRLAGFLFQISFVKGTINKKKIFLHALLFQEGFS